MSISRVCLLFLPACLYKDDLASICFVLNAAHQGFFTLMFALQVTAPICLLRINLTVCTIWEQENTANPTSPEVKQEPELVPSAHWVFTGEANFKTWITPLKNGAGEMPRMNVFG